MKCSFLKPLSQNLEVSTLFHQPKNGSKRFKLVFHVPILIERWKSKGKGTFRWTIPLWKCSLKNLKFWLNVVTSTTQYWLEKGPKLVFHVLKVLERWKSKVKETLSWSIHLWNCFSKSWNSSRMSWRHHRKIVAKRLKLCIMLVQIQVLFDLILS